MAFEIGKTFRFEAAHRLAHHDGKCRRPHGHSYSFELVVEAQDVHLDGAQAGMVDDYAHLSEVGNWIVSMFDHQDLNEVLDSDTTTAEELSRAIWELAKTRLPRLVQSTVKETERTWASYRPRRRAEFRVYEAGQMVLEEVRQRLYKGIDCSNQDECWLFQGSLDAEGYGWCHSALAGTKKAHWLSAWLAGDDIEGKVVLHTCDNPRCINPRHLYTETHEENEADKDSKGRRPVGQEHGAAKLTAGAVLDILGRVQAGEAKRAVAHRYGVSSTLVSAIATGKAWRSVTGILRPEE